MKKLNIKPIGEGTLLSFPADSNHVYSGTNKNGKEYCSFKIYGKNNSGILNFYVYGEKNIKQNGEFIEVYVNSNWDYFGSFYVSNDTEVTKGSYKGSAIVKFYEDNK